ncbi:hypothetical protein SAMN05216266_10442 [Amycolatopsis marina]|uniref:Uncharacterized protein n=1 Tax=Amycolatopsis marina TaxID=490629 RepID=A0A1I0XVC7_9PSEU|nr:hypothetical protein [Amycolatopsis marina]SFB04951.1 hypothetical protein SAMN05216266_10442 [Amycolatopsis marina]
MGKPNPANEIGYRVLGEDGKLGGGTGRPTVYWWLGFALCVLFFLATLFPGVLTLASEHTDGEQIGVSGTLLGVLNNPYVFSWIGMILLCVMWMLEYTRRGSIHVAKQERGKQAPTGSFEAEIRLLPTPLHVAWFFGLAVTSVALLVLPWTIDWDLDIFFVWFLWGALLAPVSGAVLGSLVKKTAYARWYRRQAAKNPHGRVMRKAHPFWRSFSYWWRFDLWICGAAMLMIVVGALIWWNLAYLPPGEFGDAEDVQEATGVTIVLLSIGILAMAFGLWACTQFWRSGEDIRTGESAS